MRHLFILTFLFLVACAGTNPSSLAPSPTFTLSLSTLTPVPSANAQTPFIIAHRGGAGLAPENTLASFKNGLALGADFLEMDTHLTQDNIIVVIHDPTLERTTDGRGRVGDLTLAQLQAFNAAAKFSGGAFERQTIPTFEQVLDLAKDTRAQIEVEIKVPPQGRYQGIEQKMIDAISARNMLDRVQISSFDFAVLKTVRTINPRVKTVALMSLDYFRAMDLNQPEKVIEQVMSLQAQFIAVNKDLLTAKLIEAAHARQIRVEVWTVDSPDEMKKFMGLGVEGIISNRPDVLKQVLGR